MDKLAPTPGGREDFLECLRQSLPAHVLAAVYSLIDEFVAKAGGGGGNRAPGMMEIATKFV
ncbi:hypothetical protein P4S64_19750 [Vibrio sp. M60_M31a]